MSAILLEETLEDTLYANGISPKDYGAGYDGESAGLDLFNVGDDLVIPPAFTASPQDLKLLMPTGLRLALRNDQVALIRERGSICKTPLMLRAGVIDAGYSGEVFVNCVNVSSRPYTIKALSKSPFQIIVTTAHTFSQVSQEEFEELHSTSRRAEGKIGSTD